MSFRKRTGRFGALGLVVGLTALFPASPAFGQVVGAPAGQGVPPTPSPGAVPVNPLSIQDAEKLALAQASAYQQAQLAQRSAEEDVKQARTNLLPKIQSVGGYTYTTPLRDGSVGPLRTPAYIAANSINEYSAFINVGGELDVTGRLRRAVQRNRVLLEAAAAGTEAARRDLVRETDEAYFGLALAVALRRAAERNLDAAREFQRVTELQVESGETAPVDLVRARLQTTGRESDFELAKVNESVASDSLAILLGYEVGSRIEPVDLAGAIPVAGEMDALSSDLLAKRPELESLVAQQRAAELDVKIARDERRPQVVYNVNTGFDTDTLRGRVLNQSVGASASVSVVVPIFDWGASRSRERQAQLRVQALESARTVALRTFFLQFQAAKAQAAAAERRIRLAMAAIADAEKNVDTSIARYRAGEASIIEVTDAQSTLATQRAALYQAIFDYQVARTRLIQAVGP